MSNLSTIDAQASISTPPSTPISASRQGQNAKYISGRRTLHALLLAHHTAYTRSLLYAISNIPRRYSSTRVNSGFKRVLGPKKTLFKTPSNTKVSLAAVSMNDSSIYLFSNHNGQTSRLSVYSSLTPDPLEVCLHL
jgi:hypothetical protein